MKQENNLKKIFKTYILCIAIILIAVGCNKIRPQNNNIKETIVKTPNALNENTYNGDWTFISRARFIQGTVATLEDSANGNTMLSLKVEVNFHSETDPVEDKDFPFKVGEITNFILKNKPTIDISKNKRVIVYEGQVTSNGKDEFIGAEIKYYEDKGKFYDLKGKDVTLPPKDYPSSNILSINHILYLRS